MMSKSHFINLSVFVKTNNCIITTVYKLYVYNCVVNCIITTVLNVTFNKFVE